MKTTWKTAPISATCEVMLPRADQKTLFCDEPTALAYPTHGGGWMALCAKHGEKHAKYALPIEELIESGETFQ